MVSLDSCGDYLINICFTWCNSINKLQDGDDKAHFYSPANFIRGVFGTVTESAIEQRVNNGAIEGNASTINNSNRAAYNSMMTSIHFMKHFAVCDNDHYHCECIRRLHLTFFSLLSTHVYLFSISAVFCG